MKVGFIGLGAMGRPMALHLQRAGHELHVWARNPNRIGDLPATVCTTPAELGRQLCHGPRQCGADRGLGKVAHGCADFGKRGFAAKVAGHGADTDIIVASAKAYVNALNKLEYWKKGRAKAF